MLDLKIYGNFKSETKPHMIVAYFRQGYATMEKSKCPYKYIYNAQRNGSLIC